MEVFVEQQVVAEVRIALQLRVVAEDCPPTLLVAQEQPTQSTRQLLRHLFNGDEVAGTARAFDLEVVAVVVMELLQRFDQEIIDREPDRTAPVGVAAEQATIGLGWLIAHGELVAIAREDVRVILVTLGERRTPYGERNSVSSSMRRSRRFIRCPRSSESNVRLPIPGTFQRETSAARSGRFCRNQIRRRRKSGSCSSMPESSVSTANSGIRPTIERTLSGRFRPSGKLRTS